MNESKTKQSETEVLVLGAGPTGSMAAGELASASASMATTEQIWPGMQ